MVSFTVGFDVFSKLTNLLNSKEKILSDKKPVWIWSFQSNTIYKIITDEKEYDGFYFFQKILGFNIYRIYSVIFLGIFAAF